jgi:hypothetical protein
MAFPVAAALAAGGGLLSFFGGKKREKQEAQNQIEMGRAQWDQQANSRAAKAQFVRSMLGGLGIQGGADGFNAIDPATMSKITTATPFPNIRPVSSNWASGLGSFLSAAGIGLSQAQAAENGEAPPQSSTGAGPGITPRNNGFMPWKLDPSKMWSGDGTFDPNRMWQDPGAAL